MKKNQDNKIGMLYCEFKNSQHSEDGSTTVYGWGSRDTIDLGNDIVPVEVIDAALAPYARFSNIREMHNPDLGGAGNAEILITENDGIWVQAKIISDSAVKGVDSGVYTGFSIGYILKSSKDVNGVRVFDSMELIEISVVDRPMNSDCLIERVTDEFEIKTIGTENMKKARVFDLEQKGNMPDSSFAFVGVLDGKSVRIMPYLTGTGDVDPELCIASINILNSNRPEDIEFLEAEEKKTIYATITKILEDSEFTGTVPEYKGAAEFGTKFIDPKSTDFKEVQTIVNNVLNTDEFKKESPEINEEPAKNGVSNFFSAIKKKFAGIGQGKAYEMQAVNSWDNTDFTNEMQEEELQRAMYSSIYALDRVADNIIWDGDIATETKTEMLGKAFNDCKTYFMSKWGEVVALHSITENKSIKNNDTEVIEMKKIVIDGKTYVPETPEIEAKEVPKVEIPETPEVKTEAVVPVVEESKTAEALATIMEKLEGIEGKTTEIAEAAKTNAADIQELGKKAGVSGFAENTNLEKKAVRTLENGETDYAELV